MHVRQHGVEHHQVGGLALELLFRLAPVARRLHGVALRAQGLLQQAQDLRLVVHHQDPCGSDPHRLLVDDLLVRDRLRVRHFERQLVELHRRDLHLVGPHPDLARADRGDPRRRLARESLAMPGLLAAVARLVRCGDGLLHRGGQGGVGRHQHAGDELQLGQRVGRVGGEVDGHMEPLSFCRERQEEVRLGDRPRDQLERRQGDRGAREVHRGNACMLREHGEQLRLVQGAALQHALDEGGGSGRRRQRAPHPPVLDVPLRDQQPADLLRSRQRFPRESRSAQRAR